LPAFSDDLFARAQLHDTTSHWLVCSYSSCTVCTEVSNVFMIMHFLSFCDCNFITAVLYNRSQALNTDRSWISAIVQKLEVSISCFTICCMIAFLSHVNC